MPSESELRRTVSELCASDGGYALALAAVSSRITVLLRGKGQDREIAEARVIKAEVLQKMGDLDGCLQELDRVGLGDLSPVSSQGYLLIKAKVLMQQGNLMVGRTALQGLRDRLGHGGVESIRQAYLWRQSFVSGLRGMDGEAHRLRDEHRELVTSNGYLEANNVLYAEVLPELSADNVGYTWRRWIDLARHAGAIYATSPIDFADRLNHRGKCLCQALLTEALVLWLVGNRFTSYRTAFTAALLLRHWHLRATAEGIGEVVAVLQDKAAELADGVRLVIAGPDDAVLERLGHVSDHGSPLAAYLEAVDIAVAMFHRPDLDEVYRFLDERR